MIRGTIHSPSGRDPAPTIVFAGGGSGGHVFPALAVVEALREVAPDARFAFLGSDRPFDRAVIDVPGAEVIGQPVQPFRIRPWAWPRFYVDWTRSRWQCRKYFAECRPAAVIGTGGYASGPPVREASERGIPTFLINPDALPGRANRFLAGRTQSVFVQWPSTCDAFADRDRCEVTGCPVRSQFREANRAEGLDHFGLDPSLRTLLVTGASQGAVSLNRAMTALLGDLEALGGWQVLHLSGTADFARVQTAYRGRRMAAAVAAFTPRMADAMAAADLVVSRAGASTLAEITALGKPSVLLPYPHHRDQHQQANARELVTVGAARMVLDRIEPERTAADLRESLLPVMSSPAELARMAAAAGRIGTTDAARTIAARVHRTVLREGVTA